MPDRFGAGRQFSPSPRRASLLYVALPYNALVRWIVIGLIGLVVVACTASEGSRETPAEPPERVAEPPRKAPPSEPGKAKVDREESMRRTEAVRRAMIELASRGVKTNDYLMNLIVEDDAYKVSFVKHNGRRLESEISVRVRKNDFEILGVKGAGEGEGEDGDGDG